MADRPQDWDRLSGAAKSRLLARLLSHVVHTACFGEVRVSYKDLAVVPQLGFVPDGDGEHVIVATSADGLPPKERVYLLSLDADGACSVEPMNGKPPDPTSKTIATFVAPNDDAADRIAALVVEENRRSAPAVAVSVISDETWVLVRWRRDDVPDGPILWGTFRTQFPEIAQGEASRIIAAGLLFEHSSGMTVAALEVEVIYEHRQ